MKINGKEPKSSWRPEPLVFSRGVDEKGQPEFLVFVVEGVRSYEEFDALCPPPQKTQGVFTRDGFQPDEDSPKYLDEMKLWRKRRWAWMILKSLEPSNIEWSTVDLRNPKTWTKYEDELRGVLMETEYGLLMALIHEANVLDRSKLEENRQTFFQAQARLRLEIQDGQSGDPESS